MSRSDDERVADILEAAAELSMIVEVGRESFLSSALHARAAERLLEIIGEASNSLSDEFKVRHHGVTRRASTGTPPPPTTSCSPTCSLLSRCRPGRRTTSTV